MLVETVFVAACLLTVACKAANDTIESVRRERLRKKVAIKDGPKGLTVEAFSTELLFTADEIRVLNDPKTTREQRAAAYVSAQERTEANANWRDLVRA